MSEKKECANIRKSLIYKTAVEYGDYTLEINHGHVCIQRAPCANQDCVHTGWISRPGQSIVCLPGRFIVELGGEDEHPDYDIVVK